jgi:outer membrane protein OmpA-like peptidoglycan-associated protein
MKRFAIALALVATAAHAGKGSKAPANINVTGTWDANFAGGLSLLLHQEGNAVWGKDNLDDLIRGDWADGRLTLFYRLDFKGSPGSGCSAPAMAVVTSKGTATRLEGVGFLEDGSTQMRVLTRQSPNSGADFTYPYAAELKECGSLPAHDLVFETASDQLKGSDWPLLAAVADLLNKESGMKIQILGHTDSTGDAEKNKALSQRRADAVKKVLTDKYKADAARISTKGWGSEQPLESNDTDDGRAINRRVEILVVR